ncbi:DHA2 family efflux MFS transporter permease subunit [Roseixanthobacter glucoisosaccharinicivorans]|uniref:DHA2 family efflux MFS transporter permease subunit n=1 Tax=Roseixanthobacter glucoisosaccharinicivorans TaxID=3119923 RepID=UPI0037296274
MSQPASSPPPVFDAPPGKARPSLAIPLVVALAMFMEQIDITITLTSLPAMAADLGTTPVAANFAVTAYVLSLAVFIPVSGWIANRIGARTVFCAAIALFTISSAVCGLAQSFELMVLMRIVQGAAGALMLPVGRLILLRNYPKADLAMAVQVMTTPAMIGPAIGPLLGGFLTTYLSWRWIFYVNVPIGIIGIAAVLRYIPNTKGVRSGPFDLLGFLLCAVGIATLQVGIEMLGNAEVAGLTTLAVLVLSLALLAGFYLYARRRADAVIDISLFRIRALRIGVVAGGICRLGLNGVPALLPLMYQIQFGYTAFQAGLMTILSAIGALTTKGLLRALLRRYGFRTLLLFNALAGTAVIAAFALFKPGTSTAVMLAVIYVFGMVRSVQLTLSNTLSYADVPEARAHGAVSLVGSAQQLSMGFGISLASFIYSMLSAAGPVSHLGSMQETFLYLSLATLVSVVGFRQLTREDGRAVSG